MLKVYDFEKMPVVEVVNDILLDSADRGASDIHLDPQEELMKVRIRVDGTLLDYAEVPNTIKKNMVTRIKIMAGMNITESRLPQDGAIKAQIQDRELDLRVSSLPTNEGEKVVIRILDYSMSVAGVDSLGFSDSNLKKVLKMISTPSGIILVTGATGSGKSTTVYSVLQRLNREDTNIITVEDPIEMDVKGVNQVQTNSEIGLTFASALRSILRQDPNIIMIGEIRDTETAKIAVRASITGHLVLSTLHTNNSLNTIERLLDMDVERYLLGSALEGIISQKLARKLCDHCKTERPSNDYEKKLYKKVLNMDIESVFESNGCEHCSNGFRGRIAIHEVLVINQDIRDAISNNIRKDQLRHLVYQSGVTTLLQDGLEKVAGGMTTFEELLRLIELDSDDLKDNSSSTYDLKHAIEFTQEALETNNHINENNDDVNNVSVETNSEGDITNQTSNISDSEIQTVAPVVNNIQEAINTVQANNIAVEPVFEQPNLNTASQPIINNEVGINSFVTPTTTNNLDTNNNIHSINLNSFMDSNNEVDELLF